MKNRTIAFTFFVIAFSLAHTTLIAAPSHSVLPVYGDTSLTIYRNSAAIETYLRLNEVDIHAARDFMKRFSTVTDDKWVKVDGGYLVRFTTEDKKNDAFYDDRGRFIAASCYYNENNSPDNIKALIDKEYPGYTITAATKISTASRSFYRLHISNMDFVKTLQVVNSRIRVLEELQNGATVSR